MLMNKDDLSSKWNVKYGDIWGTGDHRVACGDNRDDVLLNRLMGDELVDLTFFSPPYLSQRNYDSSDPNYDWTDMMDSVSDNVFKYTKTDGNTLVNLGLIHMKRAVNIYWSDWIDHCTENGHPLFGWYVWDKGPGLPGDFHGRLAPSFEFVFHFNNKRGTCNKWKEKKSRYIAKNMTVLRGNDGICRGGGNPDTGLQTHKIPDSTIRINSEKLRGIHTKHHPAVFPVELPEFIIRTWSNEGDTVYDPFLGSGTTVIAAENHGRRCFGCELSPFYVSLILERIERELGLEPILLEQDSYHAEFDN